MTQSAGAIRDTVRDEALERRMALSPHERWIQSLGVPVYRGYLIEDIRTLELGWWPQRQCSVAFLQLAGQEGLIEARVTEIPPGQTLPPVKFALDEVVYVADGRGLTTVHRPNDQAKTFEWQKHSLFLLPHNHTYELTNTQGERPARLLHQNYLPLSMLAQSDPSFFFDNAFQDPDRLTGTEGEFYSQATAKQSQAPGNPQNPSGSRVTWYGNFFPDMRAWDKLVGQQGRGAGAQGVSIQFPGSECSAHMVVLPAKTYKKAHRHGPGVVIVVPAGEGYSVMWAEGEEQVVVPWHEGSIFVPPNLWFHQHFNVGATPGRYLALHSPRQINMYDERLSNQARDQIEYTEEDAWIRQKFDEELQKRGLKSEMPDQAYRDLEYKWSFAEQA